MKYWLLLLFLSGCRTIMQQQPDSSAVAEVKTLPIQMQALPGQVNNSPLLNSNWPERIETPGLILSTAVGQSKAYLNYPLKGDFSLFMHHVVRTPIWDSRQMWIGILASPQENSVNGEATNLALNQGNVFLTRPDAPFIDLDTLLNNPQGKIYSGPGSRVATASSLQQSMLKPRTWNLETSTPELLYQWQVPTNPMLFLQQDNALSGLLRFTSQQAVNLSLVALYQSQQPGLQDYVTILKSGQLAGPAENTATAYDPQADPKSLKGVFRYGRVAAVAQGTQWQGEIQVNLPMQKALGFPLASLYLKRLNTVQNQSAALLSKVPGSAVESHGNYGLEYRLKLIISNPTAQSRKVALALQQPVQVTDAGAEFRVPPLKQVMFRGSVKVTYQQAESLHHLVLKHGKQAPAFFECAIAAGASETVELSLIYPADATPPQLISLWETTSQSETL